MSPSLEADVRQVRINELAGKHVHKARLLWPKRGVLAVDVLTFVVPILFFAPKLIWTDAEYVKTITAIDTVFAVVLLAAAVLRKVLGWDETIQSRRNCASQNARVANQALELLQGEQVSEEAAKLFLRLAKEPNADEQRLLESVDNGLRMAAYREALKEFEPSNYTAAMCPACHANAWSFTAGSCQLCGGTPVALIDPTNKNPSIPEEKESG